MTTQRYKMLHSETEPEEQEPHQLSPRQLEAIELVLEGKTDMEVGDSVDVHRVTVNRWRHHHPAFIAELQRRRWDRYQAAQDRFAQLVELSFDRLCAALRQDGPEAVNTSWKVISKAFQENGLSRPPSPKTSEEIQRARVLHAYRRATTEQTWAEELLDKHITVESRFRGQVNEP